VLSLRVSYYHAADLCAACTRCASTLPLIQQLQVVNGGQQQQQWGFVEWQAQQQQQLSLQQQQQQQQHDYIEDTDPSYHYTPAAPEPQRGAGHQVRAVQLPLLVPDMPVFTPEVELLALPLLYCCSAIASTAAGAGDANRYAAMTCCYLKHRQLASDTL
jgi:hypothetical protein